MEEAVNWSRIQERGSYIDSRTQAFQGLLKPWCRCFVRRYRMMFRSWGVMTVCRTRIMNQNNWGKPPWLLCIRGRSWARTNQTDCRKKDRRNSIIRADRKKLYLGSGCWWRTVKCQMTPQNPAVGSAHRWPVTAAKDSFRRILGVEARV
jgi:hypothetical protein